MNLSQKLKIIFSKAPFIHTDKVKKKIPTLKKTQLWNKCLFAYKHPIISIIILQVIWIALQFSYFSPKSKYLNSRQTYDTFNRFYIPLQIFRKIEANCILNKIFSEILLNLGGVAQDTMSWNPVRFWTETLPDSPSPRQTISSHSSGKITLPPTHPTTSITFKDN